MTPSIATIAIALLGFRTGLTLFTWLAATRSFREAELASKTPPPEFARIAPGFEGQGARAVLRYLASEINRANFRFYGWAQVILGIVLVLFFIFGRPFDGVSLGITSGMLLAALFLNFRVMPQIVRLGRTRDFLPRDPSIPDFRRFRKTHASFTSIDGLKWLAGIAVLIRLIVLRW